MRQKVFVPVEEMDLVQRFSKVIFWEEDAQEFFSESVRIEMPYAPPGMYQYLGPNEKKIHFEWLRATVSNWKWENIRAVGTNHKGLFWIFRDGSGDTCWGGIKGTYKSKFATLLEVVDGKIAYMKDFFDMTAFYAAIGVKLPEFLYDAKDPSEFPARKPCPAVSHTEESLDAQIKRTLDFFASPNYWDPAVNEVLANEFVHELTFAPKNMPRLFRGQEYDALNEWLDRHLLDGEIYDEVFYETTDPHIFITEYNCVFKTNWGLTPEQIAAGEYGKYPNREVSYVELDDNGRCVRLDEYLNTMSKFLSTHVSVQTFPYLYF